MIIMIKDVNRKEVKDLPHYSSLFKLKIFTQMKMKVENCCERSVKGNLSLFEANERLREEKIDFQ